MPPVRVANVIRYRAPVWFRNSVRGRRATSARTSITSAFPDSGDCRGLVVRLSGGLPSGSTGRSAVQIGAVEGARDPGAPARAGDPAPAAAASAAPSRRSSDPRRARAGAAAKRLDESVRAPGDVAALASPAGQAALDVPAQSPGAAFARSSPADAGCSARSREPGLGLSTDRRRTAEPWHLFRRPRFGRSSPVMVFVRRRSETSSHGATFSASTRRRRSPVISSPSRPPG